VTLPASPPRAPGCLSALDLDELLAGDLAGMPREGALRSHIDGCARCRERLSAFSAVEPPPAETMLPRVMRVVTRTPRTTRWRVAVALMTTGAAAAAVFAVMLRPRFGPGGGSEERTKGGLALTVVVKRAGGAIETVTGNGTLHPGDEMRFSLAIAQPGYAVVLGIDAAPSVTIYAPYVNAPGVPMGVAAQPIRVDSAGTMLLPGSIVADEAVGTERVVAVLCASATSPDALRARALSVLIAAAGAPERVSSLGSGCLESWVSMHKEPRAR
jgi:hypothetical protein